MAHQSTMLELGTVAPDFALLEPATENIVSKADFAGKPLLVAFLCNHCPYVVHIRDAFAAMANEYQAKGVQFVAINSNDVSTYPDDSPEKMVEEVQAAGYSFPYLFDESQSVAKAYMAACTPDLYLFDGDHKLFYRGQFDGSRPSRPSRPNDGTPVTGNDLRHALNALLNGDNPPAEQRASMGCNIKWKAGNEPDYFGS